MRFFKQILWDQAIVKWFNPLKRTVYVPFKSIEMHKTFQSHRGKIAKQTTAAEKTRAAKQKSQYLMV